MNKGAGKIPALSFVTLNSRINMKNMAVKV